MKPLRPPSASVTPIRRPHLMVCSKALDELSMNARTGTRDQSSAAVQQSYQVMGRPTCIVASHEYSSGGSAEVWES